MKKNKSVSLVAIGFLVASMAANAVPLIPGGQPTNRSFERGDLTGWQTGGDVSVQTAAIGSDPSHGEFAALISTVPWGTFSGERPLEGSFFPSVGFPKYFLEDPDQSPLPPSNYPVQTQGGNYSWLRQDINLRPGESLMFDYNYVTKEVYLDYAFLFVQSLDEPNPYQYLGPGTFYAAPLTGPNTYQSLHLLTPTYCGYPTVPCEYGPSSALMPLGPSAVDLCFGRPNCGDPGDIVETGWQSFSWRALVGGNYAIYVGVVQQVDNLEPSALLIDNFKTTVPEPGTSVLFMMGIVALAMMRGLPRRRLCAKTERQSLEF